MSEIAEREISAEEIHLGEPFYPFENVNVETILETLRSDQPVEAIFNVKEKPNWKVSIRFSVIPPEQKRGDWDSQRKWERFLRGYVFYEEKGKAPVITPNGIREITFKTLDGQKKWQDYPIRLGQIIIDSRNEEFQPNSPKVKLVLRADEETNEYLGCVWENESVIHDEEILRKERKHVEIGREYSALVDQWQTTPPYSPLPRYEKGLDVYLPNNPRVLNDLGLVITEEN